MSGTEDVSRETLAYLAGLFEGEAAMNIVRQGDTHVPAFLLHMTDRDIVEAVRPFFGNPSVVVTDRPGRKRRYTIRCRVDAMRPLLAGIYPFMRSRLKRRQADLLTEVAEQVPEQGVRPSKRMKEIRRQLWEEYRTLQAEGL